MTKVKSAFHGQSSDASGEKDQLVPQGSEQRDPYKAKGSDFSVKRVAARSGQSGAGDAGFSSGKDELASYNANQEGPRHAEDDGHVGKMYDTPVPKDRARVISSNFSVETNRGESEVAASAVSISESIDLATGDIVGGSQTRVKEVPESKVKIPSRK